MENNNSVEINVYAKDNLSQVSDQQDEKEIWTDKTERNRR